MAIFGTYSKRKKQQENKINDVYRYDNLPQALRVQIIHIWVDALGNYDEYSEYSKNNNRAWDEIHSMLCREFGVFDLARGSNPLDKCQKFLLSSQDTDQLLDLIELTFKFIDVICRDYEEYEKIKRGLTQTPDDAIEELNQRFFEHSMGFQFINGEIVKVDSQLIHQEVVKPALILLHNMNFKGPEEEFRKAFEHYRHKNYKEAMSEALKSLESTMKAISDQKGWSYPKNATSKTLIELLYSKELIPTEMQSHFTGLRSTLESGLPTIRNTKAGHGQGIKPIEVPEYLVGYSLHLAASSIVFLVNAMENHD